uniref:Uncharacterized protein n=1 Tax=Trichuris muris TaxID=70415 RepID=A0A5S6R5I3_TRIMR
MRLLLLFSCLMIALPYPSQQYAQTREKRQSAFLEGLGGPLALKPRSGKSNTTNEPTSPAETNSSQPTETCSTTTTTTTTTITMQPQPKTTSAPTRTTDARKLAMLKEKPKPAQTSATNPSMTTAAPHKVQQPTTSAKARNYKATLRPTTSTPSSSRRVTAAPTNPTRTTYGQSTQRCHSWDLVKALVFGGCGCQTIPKQGNCNTKQQAAINVQATKQQCTVASNTGSIDKLKEEILQEMRKQLEAFKKDIMSVLTNRQG